jgi:starvation-inducible DNA-binding protein
MIIRATRPGQRCRQILVDLIDLSLIVKQAHWNVVGTRFRSVHLQLDERGSTTPQHFDGVAK